MLRARSLLGLTSLSLVPQAPALLGSRLSRGMSCCPPDSTPYLAPDYEVKGRDTATPEGYVCYLSSPSSESSLGLLLIPDIYGYHGGRTMSIADYFAASGMTVLVPKLLTPPLHGGIDGDGVGPAASREEYLPWMKTLVWEEMRPKMASFLGHLKSSGVEKVSLLGFCWGSWAVFRTAAEFPGISAAAAVHPSVQVEEMAFGGSVEALSRQVHVPTLVLPAGNDPDMYRAGGVVVEALKANNPQSSWNDDFRDMVHGWVPRGDVSDANTAAKVKLAMEQVADFFKTNA